MENLLLLFLTIMGSLAIYWVVWGQWKWNKLLRSGEKQGEIRKISNQKKGKTHSD